MKIAIPGTVTVAVVAIGFSSARVSGEELSFDPRVVLNWTYTDNVFLDPPRATGLDDEFPTEPESDSILFVGSGFDTGITGRRTELSLAYDFGYASYGEFSDLNSWRHDVRVSGQRDLTENTEIEVTDQFIHTEDPLSTREFAITHEADAVIDQDPTTLRSREPYSLNTARISLTRDFSGEDSFFVQYSNALREDDDPDGNDFNRHSGLSRIAYWFDSNLGGDIEGWLDSGTSDRGGDTEAWRLVVQLNSKPSEELRLFAGVQHRNVKVEQDADATDDNETVLPSDDYEVLTPQCGLTYVTARGGSLEVVGGYFHRTRDEGKNESGLSGSIRLTRTSNRSTISLYGATGHDESIYTSESRGASTFREAGLSLNYGLARLLQVRGLVSYREDEYDIGPDAKGSMPADDAAEVISSGSSDTETAVVELSLGYNPRAWLSLSLAYSFRDYSSAWSEGEYEENRVSLTLQLMDGS